MIVIRSFALSVPFLALVLALPGRNIAAAQPLPGVPTEILVLADHFHSARLLDINLNDHKPEQTILYYGTLAAASEFATAVARTNGNSLRSVSDFLTGLWLACIWPPNKPPPKDRPERNAIFSKALFDPPLRQRLREAVGPSAAATAKSLYKVLPPNESNAAQIMTILKNDMPVDKLISVAPELKMPPSVKDLDLSKIR